MLLDACVLYPAPLRDLLIQLASTDLFRAKWTQEIHNEWINALIRNRPELEREKLERTAMLMNDAIMDCLVDNYQDLIAALNLPDPDDRHVLAAAIVGKADAIITTNLKDFPVEILDQYDIEILHPDDFLKFQFDFSPNIVVDAARDCKNRMRKPKILAHDYLATLEKQGLPKFVSELKKFEKML